MLIKKAITSLAIVAVVATCLTFAQDSQAEPCYYGAFLWAAVEKGVGPDGSYSPEVVNRLRRAGYAAMFDMQAEHEQLEARLKQIAAQSKGTETSDEKAELIKQRDNLVILIEQVARQRGAMTSGLMWHTSLEEAMKEAKETDKPILSLRMLGKLTDEFSCANSRFFRTALYSNKEISARLRKDFVLHWKSVRPVPKISIDFGDGRTLERTITGNSAHYMLDKNGRPLDCLPGLYGPGEFVKWLKNMEGLNLAFKEVETAAKDKFLKDYHKNINVVVGLSLESKMARVDLAFTHTLIEAAKAQQRNISPAAKRIPAKLAAPVAVSKSMHEAPILDLAFAADSIDSFEQNMDDQRWAKLARLHAGSEKLDESSIEVIKRENPSAQTASSLTRAKEATENKLIQLVQNFERSILIDTVRNEYLLHRKIHSWFATELPTDVEVLNKRVYAELFLTPDTDPWLGLKPENVYTALENDGVKVAAKK